MAGLAIWLVVGLSAVGVDPSAMTRDAQYAQELLAVLEETQSVDTFMVTLHLLKDLPVDRNRFVPLVIRHAERVGIFADHFGSDRKQMVERVFEILKATRPCCSSHPSVDAGAVAPAPSQSRPREEKCTSTVGYRTPILPPIRPDQPQPPCQDPPTEAEVLRALHPLRSIPYLYQESRDGIQITMERQVDKIDPPRFFPLVGPAQLHHCHWKCTVHSTETFETSYPFPFRVRKPRVDVVYIDKDCLHLAPR